MCVDNLLGFFNLVNVNKYFDFFGLLFILLFCYFCELYLLILIKYYKVLKYYDLY